MGTTQITPQPSVAGGLNLTSDLFKTDPSQWISGTNFIVGRPGGGGNNVPGKFLAAMTCPPMRQPASTVPGLGYGNLIPQRFFIARCDNTELWQLGSTFAFEGPLSQGNSSILTVAVSGSTCVLNFSTPINISSVYQVSGWSLMIDMNALATVTGATIKFLNSNSSNFATYNLGTGSNTSVVCPFSSTGGTFDPTSVVSIQITTISTINSFNFCDLRFEKSTAVSYITNGLSFPHGGSSPLTPSNVSLANATDIMAVVGCQDMVLAGVYPFNTWYKLMVGFPHTSLLTSPTGSNFYFTDITKVQNPTQNYAVLMDGSSVPYLFDPNSSPGNQFTNLLPNQPQVQVITFGTVATGGTFTLTFDGQTTGAINWNDTSTTVQTAFQALSTVGSGNCIVTGDISGATQTLTFSFSGILAFGQLPLITISNALTVTASVSFVYGYQNFSPLGVLQTNINSNVVPTGGTYSLKVTATGGGINQNATTGSLAYNASLSAIQSALQALFLPYFGNVIVASIGGSISSTLSILFGAGMGQESGAAVDVKVSVVNSTLTNGSSVSVQTPSPGSGTYALTGQIGYGGPPMKYCWTYKDMLFLANSNLDQFAVWPSLIFGTSSQSTPVSLTAPNVTFLNGNIVRVKSSRASGVTGGWDMDDYCIISTDTDLFILYGSNPDSTTGDFDLKLTRSKVGCIEQAAGKRVGQAFYFYSGEDVYVFNGVESVSITGGKIQAFLDSIPVSLRKAVTLGYNIERDLLLVHCPQLDAGSNLYFSTLTLHLQSGAWGEIDGRLNNRQTLTFGTFPLPSTGSFAIQQGASAVVTVNAPFTAQSIQNAINSRILATGSIAVTVAGPTFTLDFIGAQSFKSETQFSISANTTGTSITPATVITGGITQGLQSCCSVSMPSDGTQAKNVFFQFGDCVLEWDMPSGVTALNRPCSIQLAFNHTQSPLIKKDLMRFLLKVSPALGQGLQPIHFTFYSDGNTSTVRQFISGLTQINNTIDTLNTGVDGDSFSCLITTIPINGQSDGAFISGYTAYWQALEDL